MVNPMVHSAGDRRRGDRRRLNRRNEQIPISFPDRRRENDRRLGARRSGAERRRRSTWTGESGFRLG